MCTVYVVALTEKLNFSHNLEGINYIDGQIKKLFLVMHLLTIENTSYENNLQVVITKTGTRLNCMKAMIIQTKI